MSTLGESNVVELFSTKLDRAVITRYGAKQKYMKGNFAGKADTLFADFFVGLPFSSVLIEFKDIETGDKAERRKPLRIKLCKSLDTATLRLSLQCHFFGFGIAHGNEKFDVHLSEYVAQVCPILGGASVELPQATTEAAHGFLQRMMDRKIGLDIPDFIEYLEFLAKQPDDPTGPTPEQRLFPAQLLSFNDGMVMSLPIHTIADLRQVSRELSIYQVTTPPPPGNARGNVPPEGGGYSNRAGGGMF